MFAKQGGTHHPAGTTAEHFAGEYGSMSYKPSGKGNPYTTRANRRSNVADNTDPKHSDFVARHVDAMHAHNRAMEHASTSGHTGEFEFHSKLADKHRNLALAHSDLQTHKPSAVQLTDIHKAARSATKEADLHSMEIVRPDQEGLNILDAGMNAKAARNHQHAAEVHRAASLRAIDKGVKKHHADMSKYHDEMGWAHHHAQQYTELGAGRRTKPATHANRAYKHAVKAGHDPQHADDFVNLWEEASYYGDQE